MPIHLRPNSPFFQIDFTIDGVRHKFSSGTSQRAAAEEMERRAQAEARRPPRSRGHRGSAPAPVGGKRPGATKGRA